MGFSDKMRESLGAEGARLELTVPSHAIEPGTASEATVTIVGGTRAAQIDALIVRIVEADRFWSKDDGSRIEEQQAQELADRKGLTAGWDRNVRDERRVAVDAEVQAGERKDVTVPLVVPEACQPSGSARSHTLNVQADIKGQIDPTANARFTVG